MQRLQFIKALLGSAAVISNQDLLGNPLQTVTSALESISYPTKGNMLQFNISPIPTVKVAMIGMGNRGQVLLEMLEWLIVHGHCIVTHICDIHEHKVVKAAEKLKTWQSEEPQLHFGDTKRWETMLKSDIIDLVLIMTPWEWHTPMTIAAMENGKHVACEVPIAYSIEDCWKIIKTAELTQKHCMMLENCCYNEEELFVFNMVYEGVFGDLTHAEGAYIHDLRALLLDTEYYDDYWRLKHHVNRDGNLYPTHGLGPIAMYMDIGRSDQFDFLTSMSSRELNLSLAADKKKSAFTTFQCGDMNTTLIRTQLGKTIMLQFDVHTGRPYSRINKLVGTKAVHDGYPSRLYIEGEEPKFWGHNWLTVEEYKAYKDKYLHPITMKLKKISDSFKQGHGGMDFIMMYRLIRALNLGLPLDLNVYDGVMWSAVTPLSEISVSTGSTPIPFPKFIGVETYHDFQFGLNRDF